ncbi:MAG: YicC family protein [Ignavibacteriae bacterium]|nr:MAG: YicC family protein [Ignavibacteriota bacterium]
MAASMTGFGRAEVNKNGITVSTEVRSVNSRYLDLTLRLPRNFSQREKELKDIVRTFLNRGNLNVTVKVEHDSNDVVPLKVNKAAAKSYYKLLNEIRKSVKLKEQVKLAHLLTFSDVLEPVDEEETDETEWELVQESVRQALENLNAMRAQEGSELAADLGKRIRWMDDTLNEVEKLSKERIPEERINLHERIAELVADKFTIDQNRLELEIALLVDKLDITEECVRYRSHNKYFLDALNKNEAAGRKLNFLVQEMNREANTIGSKSSDATIAHLIVGLKEELEKIREQLQNIE